MDAGWIDLLQWPAMAVTLIAAWLVASTRERRRNVGFWLFLASNVLWIVWGISTSAWALIVLQLGLAAMNIRGAKKTDPAADDGARPPSGAADAAGARPVPAGEHRGATRQPAV